MSAITAKASRKMKKYAVLTREPRCFLGSFDFSWEQRKLGEIGSVSMCRRIFKEQTSETGDIPFYKIGTFGADPDAFISRELFEEYKSKYPYPQKGDILISASGSIGRAVEFAGNNEYFQDSNIVWLNHDERLSNPFLKCFYSVVKWAGIEGSTIKRLYNDNILNTVICMPSVPEQKRIGLFFENLDNLITLHQRKCVFLFGFFQAFISMIFTASTFSWEQRKFGELVNEIREKTKSENEDTLLSCAIDGMYLNSELFSHFRGSSNIGYLKVKKNDLILSAQNLHLGNCNVNLRFEHGIISPAYKVYELVDCNPLFIQAWVKQDSTKDFFLKASTEGASVCRKNIVWEELYEQTVSVPEIKEQEKIGYYFRSLDYLITLHQRECISFTARAGRRILTANKKRNTSSWEQRKVGDLLIERNQQAPMSDEYPLMAFIANEGVAPKGERYDRSALVTDTVNKLYKKTEKGDFIYSSNNLETGSIGLNKYGKACISPVYSIFEPTGIADSDFLGRRLVRKDFINAMVKWRQGVIYGQWRIHESDFLKIEITVPSVEEQRKIGAYLDQLDNLITLHQRKGKAAVTGCSNDANNSKGVYCKARDFGYKCCKKVESP